MKNLKVMMISLMMCLMGTMVFGQNEVLTENGSWAERTTKYEYKYQHDGPQTAGEELELAGKQFIGAVGVSVGGVVLIGFVIAMGAPIAATIVLSTIVGVVAAGLDISAKSHIIKAGIALKQEEKIYLDQIDKNKKDIEQLKIK